MNPIVRNILAVIASLIAGAAVSMAILLVLGPLLIPPPAGVNPMDLESIRANIHLFEPKHFITSFLDHALGSLVGALVVALIAASRKMTFALAIGVLHLIGGVWVAFKLPEAPTWFIVLDLVVAYIPMAYLGGKLGVKLGGAGSEKMGTDVGNG